MANSDLFYEMMGILQCVANDKQIKDEELKDECNNILKRILVMEDIEELTR